MNIRLSVANRLFLGFSAVSIGVLVITFVSVITMKDIQQNIQVIVEDVAPTEKTLAQLQNESLNLSRLVAVYFNERDIDSLAVVRDDFDSARVRYNEAKNRLIDLLSQFPGLESSSEHLKSMSTEAGVLLDTITENMIAYESSLNALQLIEVKRKETIELNEQLGIALNDFISESDDPNAQKMAYETRSVVERGGSLALQMTFASSLPDFQTSQELFRGFSDEYGALGFKMLRFARNDDAFKANMQKVATLVSALIEGVNIEGGIGPIQNGYLQLRSSLTQKLTEIQLSLTENVNSLNEIALEVTAQSQSVVAIAERKGKNARATLMISAAIVIVLSIVIGYLVAQSIKKPLTRLVSFIQRVGHGDLTSTVGHYTRDEMGDISRATDQLVAELKAMLIEIASQSTLVNQVANQTNELAEKTQVKSNLQQKEVDQSVHSIGEMSESIKEVARTAENTSQEMQSSEVEAQNINNGIAGMVASIDKLSLKMQLAVDVIQALDQGVVSIESILETIQTIAEQTNLLALNAAIEAARAGEQGRGFAVVADEVRTLATRTQSSTEEIRGKIESIQKQSNQAVETISESQRSTETVSESAREAGGRFTEFMAQIRSLSGANVSIAAAAEEQSATTEEMSRFMKSIGELTTETTAITKEVAGSIKSLNSVATDLDDAVHRFKI